jgi:DNA replication protein DnaC
MSEAEQLLTDLQFFGMKQSLQYRLGEVTQSNLSHQQFFTFLLEDEKLYRKNRRTETLRKRAKFREVAHLEDFKILPTRGITKALLQQFKTLYFAAGYQNLFFIGGTGAGKSFLAQALGYECCAAGYETLFIPVNRLFKEIEIAEAQGNYLSYLSRLSKIRLLILDDFGLRNYSHKEATIFYEILEDRYRKGSVIITSQVKPQGWATLFEDKVIAEAVLDRLMASSHTVDVKGPSFRPEQNGKKKLELEEN